MLSRYLHRSIDRTSIEQYYTVVVNNDNSELEDILGRKSASPNPLLRVIPDWFKDRYNLIILGATIIILLLHLISIAQVQDLIFDEFYYVNEANSILSDGELIRPEHPNLGKLFIASGILIFGDNSSGWRIPPVIFSAALIFIFYAICRKITDKLAAVLASVLFMFESLIFFMSGLAMLDVFSLTFMLLAFLLFLQDRYALSGLSLALSGLCKLTGFLGIFVILAYWLIKKRKQSPRSIGLFLVSVLAAFMLLMPLIDFAAYKEWLNPITRMGEMLFYHQGLTSEGFVEGQSFPWEWVVSPFGYRLTTYPHLLIFTSPTVWIFIIPSICYVTYEYIKNRGNASLFIILWFAATYLPWMLVVVATDRITYLYYFYPALGAVCIAIGIALSRLWEIQSKGRFIQSHSRIHLVICRLFQIIIVGYIAAHILVLIVVIANPYYSPAISNS
ncbi:putative membrane-bound dolichyl-phosphate-mannose-protein mannosyltransferase [Candidatus Methanophagaceae archaeon]|nr:putative membrane-bound dolichyl-phosphate-mannose-protein mannosyltransferase [Methanophagales archaeon]